MIKLLIAEDQVLVCEALASLLNMEDDLDVVGTARDGEEAVNLALSLRPDVALVDIEMPKLSGLDVVQVLQNQLPQCRTIVLTTFARPGYLQRAVKSGASGYLLKDAQVEELADAIRRVYHGEKVLNPALMMEAWSMDNPLSKRELDVLRLAARGLSTRDIAAQSYLSEGTVRNYLSEIMSKLNVQTRQEAVKIATEKGWL
ncbi:response regulator transcription factor [Alicyclobacillus pomorum]|jgi:two-component system response regulator DesR|uniref:response regulator transcription factor n=1 Tax=Alicyclobacillus pomorum TaxID=204470 RepID=UPI0004015D92|nr:response regulator transcription factor [Alicyclobacillus pomorum]